MMKVLSLFLLAAVLFSCKKDVIRGNGNTITQTKTVAPFTAVETHYDIQAIITYGTTQQVEVSGYENLLNILETPVENGVLKLKFNPDYNTVRNVNVVARIQLPALTGATIHGSNNIEVKNFANGNAFTGQIHGSGTLNVSNSAFQVATLRINGSGDIEARGLQAKEATAHINGSGNVSITVADNLNVTVNGSGNVNYWGNPAVEASIQGSGRVIKK
jgi:hypothetical protein